MAPVTKNRPLLFALLLALLGACAAPVTGAPSGGPGGGDGKADGVGAASAFREVEMLGYEFRGGEYESFDLFVSASDALFPYVTEGDSFTVEVYADDGASNPDYRIEGTLTYGVDGMMTDAPLDTSTLLPYRALAAHFSGTTVAGYEVDETWYFIDGEQIGRPSYELEAREATFRSLSSFNVEIGPEVGTLQLLAELGDAEYGNVRQGDIIKAEIWADDVDFNHVDAMMTYDADGVGAFTTRTVDVSALLPYHYLNVRLSGALADGRYFSESWALEGGETEAELTEIRATLARVSLSDVGDGFDEQRLGFTAYLTEGYYATFGDTLRVEIWAADGNPDYRIEGRMLWPEEGPDGFVTASFIDTSALLPTRSLRVRFTGELSSGLSVDQTFEFDDGAIEGTALF